MKLEQISAFIAITALLFVGCNSDNIEATVPGYLQIDSFGIVYPSPAITGKGAINVTEAWVYINDDLHSVTPLPGEVPIPQVGADQKVSLGPGIRQNGIAATRDEYPFYERIEISNVDFLADSTVTLNPVTRYTDVAEFPFMEDFEGSTISLDSSSSSDVYISKESLGINSTQYGRFIGKVMLNNDKPGLKLQTEELFTLPGGGEPVYVELDYKCNAQFIFGLVYQLPDSNPEDYPVVWIQPTNEETGTPEWKKMYIDLTEHISSNTSSLGFGFTLTAYHDTTSLEESIFYFDNLKIVHR